MLSTEDGPIKPIIFLMLGLLSTEANAAVYTCKAMVGSKDGFIHQVDTETHLDYIWLFREFPDVQASCGTSFSSETLECKIKTVSSKDPVEFRLHATAEILVGDKFLFLSAPACEESSGGCKITCTLNTSPDQ